MLCYKDKTFCASEVKTHTYGREITKKEIKHAEEIGLPIAYSCFCGGFELNYCETCLQHTNHLDNICQKCKSTN